MPGNMARRTAPNGSLLSCLLDDTSLLQTGQCPSGAATRTRTRKKKRVIVSQQYTKEKKKKKMNSPILLCFTIVLLDVFQALAAEVVFACGGDRVLGRVKADSASKVFLNLVEKFSFILELALLHEVENVGPQLFIHFIFLDEFLPFAFQLPAGCGCGYARRGRR